LAGCGGSARWGGVALASLESGDPSAGSREALNGMHT